MVDFLRELQTTIRTGKVIIGSKNTLRAIRQGKPRLVIIASNAPETIRSSIQRYCRMMGISVYVFPGSSWDLGTSCNKPFTAATLAVIDPGESNIINVLT